MANVEVSRTLVKSPPELWEELTAECLEKAVGTVTLEETEPERSLAWKAEGAQGTASIEPAGWGTKVTLTAEIEEQVASLGFWQRLRGEQPPSPRHADLEEKLSGLLDELGSAHKKRPFSRQD